MVVEIEISPEASGQIENVYKYLTVKFSKKVTDDFLEKVIRTVNQISVWKYSGMAAKKKSFRKILITPHNLMIYKISRNKILIHSVFDTRQNLKK